MIDSDVMNVCMKKCRTEKKLEKECGDVHQEGGDRSRRVLYQM
jgi:hypothetical protein